MSDTLISNVHILFQNAGYDTWGISGGSISSLGFEDDAVMGFVSVFDTPRHLIEIWQSTETSLLMRHSARLRGAGDKAWNVYCVFLSVAPASNSERREILWIDENLERTRKITATGLSTREELTNSLLPLLPIVSRPVLEHEDPTDRLRRRIRAIAPGIEDIALDLAVTAKEIVRALRDGA